MPRPIDLVRPQLRAWEREFQRSDFRHHPGGEERNRERFFAGRWLSEKLAKDGVRGAQKERIVFANGQKMTAYPDPWQAAEETYREVRAGTPPVPGLELGRAVLERTGIDSIAGLFGLFTDQGYTPEAVDRLVDNFRIERRYPTPDLPDDEFAPLFAALHFHKFSNELIDHALELYEQAWSERQAKET